MFIETRARGKKKKYYLIHTYRVGTRVHRISRYLGADLSPEALKKLRARAQELIKAQLGDSAIILTDKLRNYKTTLNVNWQRFTEEFTYHTNAIEGSAVAQEEVHNLIDKNTTPENSDEQEAVNVANAVIYIRTTKEELSLSLIQKIHQICFARTKHFAGKFRTVEVVIRDGKRAVVHQGAPAKEVKKLLEELIAWYKKNKQKQPPLILAAYVHNQFENIHPFQDGNGRVGRLLLNYVLLKHKHPPINIRLQERKRYYTTLQSFSRTGDIKPTLRFLLRCLQTQQRRHPTPRSHKRHT